MITYVQGDMFSHPITEKTILVNTVNCVGVMGKGIALEFKKRYPNNYNAYKESCARGYIRPGHLMITYSEYDPAIINLATKNHWRNPSKIEWIESGLIFLGQQATLEISTGLSDELVMPAPGCGNGGLSTDDVFPLIEKYLSDVGKVFVYYK